MLENDRHFRYVDNTQGGSLGRNKLLLSKPQRSCGDTENVKLAKRRGNTKKEIR